MGYGGVELLFWCTAKRMYTNQFWFVAGYVGLIEQYWEIHNQYTKKLNRLSAVVHSDDVYHFEIDRCSYPPPLRPPPLLPLPVQVAVPVPVPLPDTDGSNVSAAFPIPTVAGSGGSGASGGETEYDGSTYTDSTPHKSPPPAPASSRR